MKKYFIAQMDDRIERFPGITGVHNSKGPQRKLQKQTEMQTHESGKKQNRKI